MSAWIKARKVGRESESKQSAKLTSAAQKLRLGSSSWHPGNHFTSLQVHVPHRQTLGEYRETRTTMESSSKHLSSPPASPARKKPKRDPLADITNIFQVEEAPREVEETTLKAEETSTDDEEKTSDTEHTFPEEKKTSETEDVFPKAEDKTLKGGEVPDTSIYKPRYGPRPPEGLVLRDIRKQLQNLYTYEESWEAQLETTQRALEKYLK